MSLPIERSVGRRYERTPQGPFRGLTPWMAEQLLARTGLVEYVGRVYEACAMPVPSYLQGEAK